MDQTNVTMTTTTQRPVALVTGGSRGIGAAVVKALAASGFDIALNYLSDLRSAELTANKAKRHGATVALMQFDVTHKDDIHNLFQAVDETFGRLNALVNNAALMLPQKSLLEMTAERIDRMMRANITGPMLCAKQAVLRMSTDHGGSGGAIVNVSSAASRLGSPGEYIDYAASKGAIDTFTVGLAKEVATQGIRVNAVRPGSTYTDMHASGGEPNRVERVAENIPMRRGGQPHEIAEAIAWLVSDKASYTTGSILDVSGGL